MSVQKISTIPADCSVLKKSVKGGKILFFCGDVSNVWRVLNLKSLKRFVEIEIKSETVSTYAEIQADSHTGLYFKAIADSGVR